MRILLHDPAGHGFQAALARELARRGHRVHHVHCDTFLAAHGELARRRSDAPTLSFGTVSHRRPFEKYRWSIRVLQELEYGVRATHLLLTWKPDVIVSCNTPLLSQALLTVASRAGRIPAVAWVQDIYSHAAADAVAGLPGPVSFVLTQALVRLEAVTLRSSRHVVAISAAFVPLLRAWGIDDSRLSVVPNWAPIEELPQLDAGTAWGSEHGLDGKFVFMYTGTLGLKHEPDVLVAIAEKFRNRAVVVVVSEGPGRDWLAEQADHAQLGNLLLFDYESSAVYPSVIARADVLIAILTPASARYSVPSKVLTYLCAARPILAIMPDDNDAATFIHDAGAGVVVSPGDHDAALDAAERLFADSELRRGLGAASRAYAERTFSTERSADPFEDICRDIARKPVPKTPIVRRHPW